jgi:pyrroloquinoline quinone biosynthesis protein B
VKVIVLGAAAGGGFPQWNSHAEGCRRARAKDPTALPRSQAGLAISRDGERWYLLNASPDLRQQINDNVELHSRQGPRHSPIAGVVLTGGDVDVVAGLLTLRERQALTIYATQRIHDVLTANPIFEVLARDVVTRRAETLETPFALEEDLVARFFAVPGKVPLYLEEGDAAPAPLLDGTTVGLAIVANARRLLFIPSCAAMTPELRARVEGADLLFFDGTLWRDDEMVRAGVGQRTGRRMGHISLSGADGTIAAFAGARVGRKVIIHMNNSNPVLLADSAERAEAEDAGWTIARDGMAFSI